MGAGPGIRKYRNDYSWQPCFAPKNTSPWLLRFNTVDGEDYGRGRVEEFLGDLKSLEALSQAFRRLRSRRKGGLCCVSSSTTKPKTIADAGNGAIVQGNLMTLVSFKLVRLQILELQLRWQTS